MEVRLSMMKGVSSSVMIRSAAASAAEQRDVAVANAPADVFDRRRGIGVDLTADVVLGPFSG